jgi:hypothetical protein
MKRIGTLSGNMQSLVMSVLMSALKGNPIIRKMSVLLFTMLRFYRIVNHMKVIVYLIDRNF